MSQLLGIIQRLKSLQEQGEQGETQQRYFEYNGKKICEVRYLPKQDTFEIEVMKENGSTYPFDNIDITAIEIFELLQEAVQE
ncbi:DUF1797 family protein [Rossellomorea marisflavi]|jgi:uncharacterized protein YkuJ|uniref:DUF1797 family protein n=1 Tax=Rossellomorea marisflavi TaxID=189381 RepID=A0A0M0GS73_9BACI|nr:DUF1797 family protein [Rossellomorea marisflavi]KQU60547.1 hypothetical protein ASG66_12950 [Bacillus sp. Leaf406]MBV6683064.1 DUF1797 family protein [Bacillus sp. JRC01]VXB63839.1 putative RNA-specific modification enzyme subunit [Bacillus sp. 349Y]KON92276.1 hypothetical protein AF331_07450 [Rossellomorea marisflavi]MCM2590406.1 DUF1797 family protein [Rossellomorea marisflavi]